MLDFRPVTLSDRSMIEGYFSKWGGHSCQYSFMSLFGTQGMFGDMVCEKDDVLYFLRTKRCTSSARAYLFPLGDFTDRTALRKAVMNVLEDAHSRNFSARFEAVSKDAAEAVQELFSGLFRIEPSRDYSEYIHRRSSLADYPGSKFSSRRYDYNCFFRHYAGRVSICLIREEHIPAIREFQECWLALRKQSADSRLKDELDAEHVGVCRWLDHYSELGLSGIVVFVDGELKGYAFGYRMDDSYYDVLVEKGDNDTEDIYCVLVRELVRKCCADCDYINREEDCGTPGLRKAKMSYRPDFMLEKFTICEIADNK
ncbi:MAG: DUF2156 domain-containing protein [Synergistaceae bacterium]|nr:DUF2156 domain-containing protein [Synergistaceae bacterium]